MATKKVQEEKCCRRRSVVVVALAILAISLGTTGTGLAAGVPKTVAEIALYQGPDREKILIDGARKEGQMTLYNSNSYVTDDIAPAFEKKYPFIKVLPGRAGSEDLLKRVIEEYGAGRYLCDVIETSDAAMQIFHREGIFQEYYTPEGIYYKDEVKKKGTAGVYYMADRETTYGLGFNTDAIPRATAPKTLKDLLDPKWKGKMSMVGSSTGIRWIGSLLDSMGRDYVESLSRQDIKVQNITAVALVQLIVSGEVPISPTAGSSDVAVAKLKGAPVEWRPLEPTLTGSGLSGMTTKAPHPHAAVLFLDFIHSKEGQEIVVKRQQGSPRTDIVSPEGQFKKSYIDSRYPIDEYEKRYNDWSELLKTSFIKKR